MNYFKEVDTRNSLLSELDDLHIKTPVLGLKVRRQISLLMCFLSANERQSLNLASYYSLNGIETLTFVFMGNNHPMKDIFTNEGKPKDVAVVVFIRNTLEKQRIGKLIQGLEASIF